MFLLPDGNAISPEVVRSVTHYEGKGVMCRDAQARPVCFIKETDADAGRSIRDISVSYTHLDVYKRQCVHSAIIQTSPFQGFTD